MFTTDDYQKLLRGRDPLYTPNWMNALADHLVYIEAEITRKKALNDDLVAECTRDKAEITRLEAVNAELAEALDNLLDEVAAAGLINATDFGWPKVVSAARAALARALPQPLKAE